MNTWAPLWSGIVRSSIWHEPDYVLKVFLTMMALKDADHVVRLSAFQLADAAKKTEQEVLDALKVLCSPDTKRLEPQPFEGRRIKAVEEGWLILNGEKYRSMVSLEMKRARNRRAQAAFRERKNGHPTEGELEYTAAAKRGEPQHVLDAIVTKHLPKNRKWFGPDDINNPA